MSVRSTRDILINLLGRETISGAADKADRGLGKLDDRMKATAADAKKLDAEIDKAEQGLKDLAVQYARTGDAAERIDLSKAMRRQQSELRKLVKARDLLPEFDAMGREVGDKFGAGFVGRMGPVGAAVGAALAVGILPPLAAALGGATLSAGVVGAVAGGVALAARDSRVQAAGKELGNAVLADLENTVGARFVDPTLDGIRIIRQGWQDIRGDVDGIAQAASRFVEPLSRGLVGLFREFAPGLRRGLEQAGPVVRELELGLTRIGRSLGDLFDTLGDNADEGAAGLRWLFLAFDEGIGFVGGAIDVLGDFYRLLLDVSSTAGELADKTWGWIPGLGDLIDDNNAKLREQRQALEEGGDAGSEAGDKAAGGFRRAGAAADESAAKVTTWADMVSESVNRALTAENAANRQAEAFRRLGEAARDGAGEGIDRSTEAGLRNRQALVSAAEAANANAAAVREVTGNHELAAAVTEQARKDFLNAADAMGAERGEAKALANQLFGIPNVKRDVDVDTKGARSQVVAYREWLRSVNLDKTSTITQRIVAEQGTARGGVREFSAGGPVTGPGPKGVDSVKAMLAPGEHVLTAAEVDRAGGHAGVQRLRAMLRAGGPVAPATVGGPPAAGGPPSISATELAAAVRSALSGLTVVMDGRAVGALMGRQADIYGRGV